MATSPSVFSGLAELLAQRQGLVLIGGAEPDPVRPLRAAGDALEAEGTPHGRRQEASAASALMNLAE